MNNVKYTQGDVELLRLADFLLAQDALHVAEGKPRYDQRNVEHPCQTPACALGHGYALYILDTGDTTYLGFDEYRRYGIKEDDDWAELFGSYGCGHAKSAQDAATYIRGFVARRVAARLP